MKRLLILSSWYKKEPLPKVELINLPVVVKKPIIENSKRDFVSFDNWMRNLRNEHYANQTEMNKAYQILAPLKLQTV